MRREVDAGRIGDRDDVVAFLNAQGFQTPRAGKDYVTIIEPETGERVRLKGGLYNRENFDPANQRRRSAMACRILRGRPSFTLKP